MPALLTSPSRPPKRCDRLPPPPAPARPPSPCRRGWGARRRRARAARPRGHPAPPTAPRSTAATRAVRPAAFASRASRTQVARPIPLAAPVTSTRMGSSSAGFPASHSMIRAGPRWRRLSAGPAPRPRPAGSRATSAGCSDGSVPSWNSDAAARTAARRRRRSRGGGRRGSRRAPAEGEGSSPCARATSRSRIVLCSPRTTSVGEAMRGRSAQQSTGIRVCSHDGSKR